MKLTKQLIIYALLAFACGWAIFVYHPVAVGGISDELLLKWESVENADSVLWVDARVVEDFNSGHFRDAILLNEEDWESGFVALLDRWMPDQQIIVYCSSKACLRSHHVALRLRDELGAEDIYALEGGWDVLQNK